MFMYVGILFVARAEIILWDGFLIEFYSPLGLTLSVKSK